MADAAQRLAFVSSVYRLGGVFDDEEAMALRQRDDGVHLAGYACIMHQHDRPAAICDQRFELLLIDIGLVRPAICKNDFCAAQHKGIGRGRKSKRRHDDFIAGLYVEQQRCHLQRIGAAGGQQAAAKAVALLHEAMTSLGEVAVAGELAGVDCLVEVVDFLTCKVGQIEGDFF